MKEKTGELYTNTDETLKNDIVSIVIPTYNRANLIYYSIDSALNQSYKNIEVIIIDDGSTDNTKDVCMKYGDRVAYFYKPNGGIASALNYGIKVMKGTWFKWLSSDDVLTSDAVEKLLAATKSTGGHIVYSDFDMIDDNNNYLYTVREEHCKDYYEFASRLWFNFIGNGSSIIIHRSCFDVVGLFDESLRFHEDLDWWLRACMVHGYMFYHVPEILLKYRKHSQQTSAEIKDKSSRVWHMIKNNVRQQAITSNKERWNKVYRAYIDYYCTKVPNYRIKGLIRRTLVRLSPEGEERMLGFYRKMRKTT